MRRPLFRWLDKKLSARHQQYPVLLGDDYQKHADIVRHAFGDSEAVQYTTPHHFDDLLAQYISTIGITDYPAPFILDIQEGKILGRHALVTTANNQIIGESVFNHLSYIELLSSGRIHFPKTLSEFIKQMTYRADYETIFVLANYFGNAFYHWMLESLPRLWLLQEYQKMIGHNVPVLLSQPLPEFAKESLDIFGIKDIIFWDATRAKASHLLMPKAINGTGIPSPRILQAMSQQLVSGISETIQFDSPRIYISRKNSGKRRVINEEALINFVQKHDFEIFTLETLSFSEQVALFQQAEVVIGAHGAGFANCIHSKDIKMLEFFEPDYINICFYRLACGFGFEYGYLIGESDGADIVLDVTELESMMRKMKII